MTSLAPPIMTYWYYRRDRWRKIDERYARWLLKRFDTHTSYYEGCKIAVVAS